MSAYYFDTSALVKRYVAEVGSTWVRSTIARRSGHVSYASVLAQPEAISALQQNALPAPLFVAADNILLAAAAAEGFVVDNPLLHA